LGRISIKEESLTGTSFNQTIVDIKGAAPHLWDLLHHMGCTAAQQLRNTHKTPEKVGDIMHTA
jgi:hypothetical protein